MSLDVKNQAPKKHASSLEKVLFICWMIDIWEVLILITQFTCTIRQKPE